MLYREKVPSYLLSKIEPSSPRRIKHKYKKSKVHTEIPFLLMELRQYSERACVK